MTPQNDVLNLLTGAIYQDSNRLQCKMLRFAVNVLGNVPKFISWTNARVFCKEIMLHDDITSSYDEELLDLFKFMELKRSDEYQVVEFIHGNIGYGGITEELKRDYPKYFVKEVRNKNDRCTANVFEFVNTDVGKKLQLSIKFIDDDDDEATYISNYILTPLSDQSITRPNTNQEVGEKKMHRFAQLFEKLAKPSDEAQREPGAKKKRSDGRTTTIATLDDDTMVEVFKHMNYCQLAKKGLVSKRYRDLIRTNRHRLALLYVDTLVLSDYRTRPSVTRVFNQKLSPEAYNEWVSLNGYSKQIPIEGQVVGMQNAQDDRRVYLLNADYNGPNSGQYSDTNLFYASTKLSHENWPVFQHFVRLLLDPIVYIRRIELIPQSDVLNLMAGAFNQDSNRLQCKTLKLNFEGNVQTFIGWIKSHVSCDEIIIHVWSRLEYEEELFDLFVTGANCTSGISFVESSHTKVVVGFVKKFMDLKRSDECRVVESVRGEIKKVYDEISIDVLKRDYPKCFVKEVGNKDHDSAMHVLEFVNTDVGKKLQLSIEMFGIGKT
ncbi:hypothetical protein DdX_15727 [Ditylenchus destructor]|uniref:F-box domain-containing protein n=1 Tax=Ditylenchus destructor TaxID=166010 RepID=A0AAD4MP17_9BILA|nr:hypothetical protein DdX_15727 [Ditylenchus destructor]